MRVQQKSVRSKEIYASIVANLPVMVAGIQAGFPAFVMSQLENEIDLDVDQMSWLVFLGYFALLFGPIIVAFVVNKFSRRTNLRLTMCLFIVGWSVVLISTNFLTLIIGTIVCGVAAGSSLPLASTYVAEISRAKYRGPLLGMVWMIGIVGTVVVYILEFSLPWRGVVFVIILLSAFGIYQLGRIPESKFWYLMNDRKEEALKSAAWFENTKVALKEVEILYALIKFGKNVTREEDLEPFTLTYNAVKSLPLRPFLLTVMLSVLRCGSGKALFTVYPTNMFNQLGTPYDGRVLAIWFGVLTFLSCIVNLLIFTNMDRFNRKNVFYIFNVIMVASLLVVIGLQSSTDEPIKPLPKLIVLCTLTYLLAEGTGYFSILSVMVVEIMPIMQRAVSISINFLIVNVVTAIYLKIFPYVENHVSFRTLCAYFLVNILVVLFIVKFFVPDSRGKLFTGYEKMLTNAIKNGDIEKIMSNDWLRNEELQRFLTEDERFNVDILNSEAVTYLSKELIQQMRDIVVSEKPKFDKYLESVQQSCEIVNETQNQSSPLLEKTPDEPIITEQLFDSMKNTFNILMEKNPWFSQNETWKANKDLIYQQQEWIKNTWVKGAQTGSKKIRKSPPNKSYKVIRAKNANPDDSRQL